MGKGAEDLCTAAIKPSSRAPVLLRSDGPLQSRTAASPGHRSHFCTVAQSPAATAQGHTTLVRAEEPKALFVRVEQGNHRTFSYPPSLPEEEQRQSPLFRVQEVTERGEGGVP
ncbi:hypothetical protein MUK42_08497 [Musa troglodytarum]|uniref:Uncharacterized protein n=1 Tax=Musa troglodytarum TaxID=320322 RepID=A0A9E7JSB4_9LILI|nr:hypothetical protein MUK42_08497 [Musa troglodytarum]